MMKLLILVAYIAQICSAYSASGYTSYMMPSNNYYTMLKAAVAESTDLSGRLDNCPDVHGPRCDPDYWYRQADGSCNNLNITWWGKTKTIYKRLLNPAYQDDVDSPRSLGVDGRPLKSPREIANKVHFPSDKYSSLSNMFTLFSQFVMHDVSYIAETLGIYGEKKQCTCKDKDSDCLKIEVPKYDYRFRKQECLSQIRSADAREDFECAKKTRQQMNLVNSWVDLSQVYGNSKEEESELRAFYGGRLEVSYFKGSSGPLLPNKCPAHAFKLLKKNGVCFKAGDSRVNQYPQLTAVHTIFVREHNRIAYELSIINPHWNDERVYQETKRILSAIYQNIAYWEWLPYVLGKEIHNLFELDNSPYGTYFEGYNQAIFPNPTIEFSAAAARFGHALSRPYMTKANDYFYPVFNESTRDIMFRPDKVIPRDSLGDYIRGLISDSSNQNSPYINDELSNWLVVDNGNSNPTHFYSLPALNINRGRETGLAPYAYYRELANLNFPHSFNELSYIDPKLIKKLRASYKHVADIDLFTGGSAENSVNGGVVGPTFAYIIARGFRDWKYGDRWWFENSPHSSPFAFNMHQLDAIRNVRLSSIVCNTVSMKQTPNSLFNKAHPTYNKLIPCEHVYQLDLNLFKEHPSYSQTYVERPGTAYSTSPYSTATYAPYTVATYTTPETTTYTPETTTYTPTG